MLQFLQASSFTVRCIMLANFNSSLSYNTHAISMASGDAA